MRDGFRVPIPASPGTLVPVKSSAEVLASDPMCDLADVLRLEDALSCELSLNIGNLEASPLRVGNTGTFIDGAVAS